jgi:hypothetical protein
MTKRLDSHSLRQRWRSKIAWTVFAFFITLSSPVFGIQVEDDVLTTNKRPPIFASPDEAGTQPQQIWLDERERLNLKCPLKTNATFVQWLKGWFF